MLAGIIIATAMSQIYTYNRPVQGKHYHHFRRLLILLVVVALVIAGIVGYFIYQSKKQKPQAEATAPAQQVVVSDNLYTTQNDYFKFTDKGKWVLKQNNSTSTRLVYQKYQGETLLHNMYFFINTEPSGGDLTVSRVLPVRIVNNNSFDVTHVSNHCGTTYKEGEPHNVKVVKTNDTSLWCNPDAPNYRVAAGVIGGDWHLNLQRKDKTPISFEIIYEDVGLDPQSDDFVRVMSSFQAL